MQGLATAISGFYEAEEIEVAKCKLFETAKDVFTAPSNGGVAEALPRQQVRRVNVSLILTTCLNCTV